MTEISETSNPALGVVLYDDACGMCLRAVAGLRPLLEPRGFRFEPFPDGAEKIEMKLVLPSGDAKGGADAVVAMAQAVWWLRPLAFLTRLPGVMSLLRRGYRKVAANRHCISGACGWTPPAKSALTAPIQLVIRPFDLMDTTPNPKVILAGGTGFLGRRLQRVFATAGYDVVVLTRGPDKVVAPARGVAWDPARFTEWTKELEGAAAVVNLAGKNVNCRYTKANRAEILKSRINSVRALAEAVRRCKVPPEVWVQAGSLAIYGDAGPLWCDETAPVGEGFGAEICRKWEAAFFKAPLPPIRRVMLRIGFVLGNEGGALPVLARLAKWFVGAPAGNGKQLVSWIHAHDMDRIFLRAVEDPALEGLFNACTAGPVTNAELMAELRGIFHRPWIPGMPAWMVHAAAWAMGSVASLALTGRRGLPGRLMEAGFRFDYPALGPALDELLLGPRLPVAGPERLVRAAAR